MSKVPGARQLRRLKLRGSKARLRTILLFISRGPLLPTKGFPNQGFLLMKTLPLSASRGLWWNPILVGTLSTQRWLTAPAGQVVVQSCLVWTTRPFLSFQVVTVCWAWRICQIMRRRLLVQWKTKNRAYRTRGLFAGQVHTPENLLSPDITALDTDWLVDHVKSEQNDDKRFSLGFDKLNSPSSPKRDYSLPKLITFSPIDDMRC